MLRSGRPQRRLSASSSSSTSPERGADDDNDSFMLQGNDSQSSLALSVSGTDAMVDSIDEEEYLRRCRIPVYRLPAEILISIFARLSSTRDLQSCMLVSKEWARNSVGLLWHRPSMVTWPAVHAVIKSIRKVDKMFAYQDLVKRLNLSTLGANVSDGTLLPLTACKRIERLTLTTCTKLTDLSLVPLIDGNRSLVALDVTGMEGLTDATLKTVSENCLRLQGLNVSGCRRLTDESIVAVARNCRHLKRLKFNSCTSLTDKSIMNIASNSCHLLEIDLFDLPNVESPSVTHLLSSCRHLRELRLMRCPRVDDSAFTSIPSKTLPFDALRVLDLTDCTEIGDKAVEKIVSLCPRLRNLLLAKCRNLTDRAVFAITKLAKNLHYLHLGHCTRLTDESIKALARHCTRIRYIDLACCSNLTDASITMLAASLPKLKRVGLVKCAGITDRSIHALATYGGRMPHGTSRSGHNVNVLERVHLSYCTSLTIEGIHTLLNNCPRLTHLSLTGVQAFLREDLTVFCREAPSEFNDHQRDVFCVFSGPGVVRLRAHLNKIDNYRDRSAAPEEANGATNPQPLPPPHQHLPALPADMVVEDEDLDEDIHTGGATPDNGDDDDGPPSRPIQPAVMTVPRTTRMNGGAVTFVPAAAGAAGPPLSQLSNDMVNYLNPRYVHPGTVFTRIVTNQPAPGFTAPGQPRHAHQPGPTMTDAPAMQTRIPAPPPPLLPGQMRHAGAMADSVARRSELLARLIEERDRQSRGAQQVTGMMGAAALEDRDGTGRVADGGGGGGGGASSSSTTTTTTTITAAVAAAAADNEDAGVGRAV